MGERVKTRADRQIAASAELARHPEAITLRFGGAVVGTLVGLTAEGVARIDFPANPDNGHQTARSCVELNEADVGKSVVLQFDEGDYRKPIVLGVILLPGHSRAEPAKPVEAVSVEADGKVVELVAAETLTLRCGNASITLTSDGKVLVKGAQIHTRSSGVNRIQGASVRIN